MTPEDRNKAVMHRIFDEIMNQGKLAVAAELFTPTFVRHDLGSLVEGVRGVSGVQDLFAMVRGALPDVHVTVEDMVAEGDKVVTRVTMRGTHKAELLGVPATGRAISFTVININRLEDGRLAEVWQLPDALGLMRQLGAVR